MEGSTGGAARIGATWTHRVGLLLVAAEPVLITLAMDPLGADSFSLPKAAVSRASTYVLAALLVAFALRGGRPPASRLWLAVGAFVVVAGLATALAVHTPTALYGTYRRYLGFASTIDGVVLALAVASFVRTARDLRWIVVGLFASGSAALGYGALQLGGLDPIHWVDEARGSTIGNAGAYAGFLVAVIGLALAYLLFSWSRSWVWIRAAGLAFVMVAAGGVLLTGARGPSLALPVVFGLAILLWVRRGPRAISSMVAGRGRRLLAGLSLAAVVVLGLAFALSPAGSRVGRLLTTGDGSTLERMFIYSAAIEAVRQHPLLGVGPDGFGTVYLALRPAESAQFTSIVTPTQTSTHSWVLHQAVGSGLVGLALFVTVAISAIGLGWKRLATTRSPVAAMGVVGLCAFLAQGAFNVSHVGVEWLFWLSLGLTASPALGSGSGAAVQAIRRARERSDLPPLLVALFVGATLASTVVPGAAASRFVQASNTARARGDLELAERSALRAVEADPSRADHWNVLGLARSPRSAQTAARAFERAAREAPYDPVYVLNLAREEAILGQQDASARDRSIEHAHEAAALDPNGPVTHARAAEILVFDGEPRSALRLAERAIQLSPRAAAGYEFASRAQEALGDARAAAETLRQMIELATPVVGADAASRVRLARLYFAAGDSARVREVVAPPRLDLADHSCAPLHPNPDPRFRPHCVRVAFTIEEALQADAVADGSVIRVANYLVNGRPLPSGAQVSYDGGRFVIIQLPASVSAPGPGSTLTVRHVSDLLGQVMSPDPATVPIQ